MGGPLRLLGTSADPRVADRLSQAEVRCVATPVQIAKVIKSALDDLDGENDHHAFEQLCRELARRRIASNVRTATGPVSAGGDQGRDFETFRTYLADELPFAIGFVALASRDVVVFACTIQQDDLKSKFKSDINAICTQGTQVDRVCLFATGKVSTRVRHDVENWAKGEHGIALEIFDRFVVAEWLAEPDLYWIAQEYLHLPAELAPQVEDSEPVLPEWYVELRADWQAVDRQPSNIGDMFDLRRGLRHAVPPGPARVDLDGWLTLMTRLAECTPDADARLHAIYEIVCARCRGVADLRPAESLIRSFMTDVELSEDPSLLFDASVLVQFCVIAVGYGHSDLAPDEVLGWVPQLRRQVDRLLGREWGSNTRAGLLQVAVHLALHVDFSDAEFNGSATLAEIDERYEAITGAIESGTLHGFFDRDPNVSLVDLDGGMQRLLELVELLPHAPVYPIDALSTVIEIHTPVLRDHPLYRQVCDGLDDAVRRQEGDAAVGDRCRQRATSLLRADRLLEALREFHQTKVKWFHGDTYYGAVRAIANIVDIYSALGMYLAAKKYALAMGYLAHSSPDRSDREFVPMALFSAANMDHLAGAWISSARLAAIAGQVHLQLAPDAGNLERHKYVTEAMKFQAFTTVIAEQTRPEFMPALRDILEHSLFEGLIRPTETHDSAPRTEQQWTDWLSDRAGAPFSDVGAERTITFCSLGVRWTVHCQNEQSTVLATEDFTAILQILLVEFASLDPVLIPQDVDVEVRIYQATDPPERDHYTRLDSELRRWLLLLPDAPQTDSGVETGQSQALHLAFQVLIGNSLLDQEQFSHLMDEAARNGLFHNLEIGRPYQELARLHTEPTPPLSDSAYRPLANPERPNPRAGSSHLRPCTGLGPGYTEEKAHAILSDRYDVLPRPVRHTLPELLDDERVRALFLDLRAQGWKDWHLLCVVMNLTVQARIESRHGPLTAGLAGQLKDEIFDEALRDEQLDDLYLPAEKVTREAMEIGIRSVAMSSLRRWGLELHHGTAIADPVVEVLNERYGFWTYDIPHADPFHGRLAADS